MLSDPFIGNPAKGLFRRCRAWYALAIALALFSIIAQQPLALLAALFALLIGLIPEIWYRRALRSLVVLLRIEPQHVLFGEEVTCVVGIENQKLLPLPWLKIACPIFPPLTAQHIRTRKRERLNQIDEGRALWSLQRLTRYHRMRCLARGCYLIGPLRLRSGDPLGWFEREVVLPQAASLIVYPLVVPLAALGLARLRSLGDAVTPRRLLEDPLWQAGVREYQVGDDPRRIHWKATARVGALQSKLYEHTSAPRVLILLDIWNASPQWMGADREIQELAITLAASLTAWALDDDLQVGLLANGVVKQWFLEQEGDGPLAAAGGEVESWQDAARKVSAPGVIVPFSRHQSQYDVILSTLACLAPEHSVPMEQLLEQEEQLFRYGTTVLLVSAATTLTAGMVDRLLELRRQGAAIHLVLIGEEQENICEVDDLPVTFVSGELWHQLVEAVEEERYERIGTLELQLDQHHHPSPV